jgi:putative peptidoglycan lipid II flippase
VTAGRALARAGLIVTGASLVSRILGWVRLAVISTTFGVHGDLDAFFAAFRLPDLLFQLVAAGAIASALIPTIATLLAGGEEARAWRVVSTILNLMLLVLAALAVVVFAFAPAIVPAITPGFDPARADRTIELTRIMLLSPILLAGGSVATSVLNARGLFGASVLAPIVYNLAIIAAAVFLAPSMGVTGLAVGVVGGAACQVLVQLPPMIRRAGFRYAPAVDLRDREARTTILLLVPRAIGLAGAQLQLIAATTLASSLAVGSVAAFNIAFTTFQIPIGVLAFPLGIVALPALSQRFAAGAVDEFVSLVQRSLRLMAFVMVPLGIFGSVVAFELLDLLFGYGKVDAAGLHLTSDALVVFFLALPAETAIVVLARAFFAGRDTTVPVATALLGATVSVAISVVTVGRLGVFGLALGISVASWLEALLLLAMLERRLPAVQVVGVLRGIVLFAILGALAGAVLRLTVSGIGTLLGPDPGKIGLAIELAGAALVGGLVYLGLAIVLRVPEVPTIVRLLRGGLGRAAGA